MVASQNLQCLRVCLFSRPGRVAHEQIGMDVLSFPLDLSETSRGAEPGGWSRGQGDKKGRRQPWEGASGDFLFEFDGAPCPG